MDENTFWTRVVKYIVLLLGTVVICITTYWTVDRAFQGHAVVISPQTVVQTK